MFKKWLGLGLVFGLLIGSVALISSCGTTTTGSATTTAEVTISGAAAVSSSDLAKLGVVTLSVKSAAANENYLKSKGFSAASINALGLVPLAASGTVISVGTINSDGSITSVATAAVDSDGSYSLTIAEYDTSKAYQAIITKTSGNKTLEMKTIFGKPSDGAISGTNAKTSPQTTMLVEMIMENVVKTVGSGDVDSDTITNVAAAIIAEIDDLIADGIIMVTTVKDSDQTTGATLSVAKQAALNDLITKKLEAIKGSAQLNAATDLASAKGAIKTIFKWMMNGDERGVPDKIISSFAQAYLDGTTIKTSQIAPAMNNSMYDNAKNAVSGSFTTAQIAAQIQSMLQGILNGTAPDAPANISYVVELAFPKATWASAAITADTTYTVPQGILLVGISEKLAG
ncbi:MAG: hypothetical protein ABIA67_05720, partial [Candidatus Margulisiibacteriota bacterium]